MIEPAFDKDGYPTEDTEHVIRKWPISDGFHALMGYVRDAWRYPEYFVRSLDGTYEVSTGGWSGNEQLMSALRDNALFWALCWQSSKRGGHHTFLVRSPIEP